MTALRFMGPNGSVVTVPDAVIPAPSPPAALRIMPLGDSISDGYYIPGGYRIGLWSRMQVALKNAVFVGSLVNGPTNLGSQYHEGHSGYTIGQIAAGTVGWLAGAKPDITLLLAGTNDLGGGGTAAQAGIDITSLIGLILANSSAKVVVGSLPPLAIAVPQRAAYNALLPGIAAGFPSSRVYFADVGGNLTDPPDMYLTGNAHPSASGFDKMAATWWTALTGNGLL